MLNGLLLTIILLLGGLILVVVSIVVAVVRSETNQVGDRTDLTSRKVRVRVRLSGSNQAGGGIDLDLIERVGEYAESTDGTYRLTWSELFRGEPGGYVLKRGNSKLCSGKLARPSGGKVARNGTFILAATGRTFRVYGFSSDGEQILNRAFRAWPCSTGISDSGKYAVVQLASAPSKEAKEDGGALVFLDLTTGKVRWKRKPETGWAASYRFDDMNRKLGLVYEQYGTFAYSYEDGRFEDSDNWDQRRIRYGSGQDILAVCREKLAACSEGISRSNPEELLSLVQKALDKQDVQDNDRIIAKALRLSGEIHEQAGEFHQAIEQYEKALDVDEKVGVKLKLRRLRKMLI